MPDRASRPARLAGLATSIIGLSVLAGWALDIGVLRDFLPGVTNPMVASTAACFVLLGGALFFLSRSSIDLPRRLLGAFAALAGMTIAGAVLGGYAFGWEHGLDRFLYRESAAPFTGEMAFPTAFTLWLLGASLLIIDIETRKGHRPAQVLVLIAALIPTLELVNRLYAVPSVARLVPGTVVMALHTALAALLLSTGVLAARRDRGLMRVVTSPGTGGWLLRRLLPTLLAALFVAGWLRVLGQQSGLFDTEFGAALLVVISTALMSTAVLLTARSLERSDARRRQSEQQLRAVLDSMGEGVVTTDAHRIIRSVNPAMERLSGWRQADAVGRPYTEVFPVVNGQGEPVRDHERYLTRAIAKRTVVATRGFEASMLSQDGHLIPIGITAAPILDGEGELAGGVAVIREVAHEQEVDRLKSSLISTASHELRTPLTMIQGFAELLKTRDLPPVQVHDAADQIHRSSERLARLIDDLLSVSRIEAGRLEVRAAPVDLAPIISEAVAPFSEGRPIRVDLNGDASVAVADPDLVHRILTNLLSNAVKYSPATTGVTVEVHRHEDVIEVAVRDEGVGMTEAERSQLFKKFFRADRQEVREAGGTGLGLFITKNLVEMQGGEMRVESAPGEGSTFAFTLPAAVEARVGGGT
ncbi:MAG TPA: ATP-binding protein [Actinomycetota bacterium]|nr:ATP-binding protein [Actinomycetota bacterium]